MARCMCSTDSCCRSGSLGTHTLQPHGFTGKRVPLTSHLQFPPFPGGSSSGRNQELHRVCSASLQSAGGSSLIPAPWRRGLPAPCLCALISGLLLLLCWQRLGEFKASPSLPSASQRCLGILAVPSSQINSKEHTGAWRPAWEEVAQTSSWEDGVSVEDSEPCLGTHARILSRPWQHRGGHGNTQPHPITEG